jgi:hypothetical protein
MFLKGTGQKGGAHSVSSCRVEHKGITQGRMGMKGNKETFSPHSDGNVEML